jgi:hypothetical protein
MVHMGFALRALSSISSLCNPLLRSHSWRQAVPDGQRHLHAAPSVHASHTTPGAERRCAAAAQAAPAAAPRPTAPTRPLRVILRQQDDGACRLLISGRMADVCAELDRLALH